MIGFTRMEGVTTAIIAFIFVCMAWPHIVKQRHQFYMALVLVLVAMLFQTLDMMINRPGFSRFAAVMVGFLQIGAVILLVLAAGGLSMGQFMGDMGKAIEVLRRGEEEKEIIIPRGGQSTRSQTRYSVEDEERDEAGRYTINEPPAPIAAPGPPPAASPAAPAVSPVPAEPLPGEGRQTAKDEPPGPLPLV